MCHTRVTHLRAPAPHRLLFRNPTWKSASKPNRKVVRKLCIECRPPFVDEILIQLELIVVFRSRSSSQAIRHPLLIPLNLSSFRYVCTGCLTWFSSIFIRGIIIIQINVSDESWQSILLKNKLNKCNLRKWKYED